MLIVGPVSASTSENRTCASQCGGFTRKPQWLSLPGTSLDWKLREQTSEKHSFPPDSTERDRIPTPSRIIHSKNQSTQLINIPDSFRESGWRTRAHRECESERAPRRRVHIKGAQSRRISLPGLSRRRRRTHRRNFKSSRTP